MYRKGAVNMNCLDDFVCEVTCEEYYNENRCACCGEVIPEGRQICKKCEEEANAATVPAIPIKTIRKYLLDVIDEWRRLGDRRFEPANIQVYNCIRACLDDLERYEDASN